MKVKFIDNYDWETYIDGKNMEEMTEEEAREAMKVICNKILEENSIMDAKLTYKDIIRCWIPLCLDSSFTTTPDEDEEYYDTWEIEI